MSPPSHDDIHEPAIARNGISDIDPLGGLTNRRIKKSLAESGTTRIKRDNRRGSFLQCVGWPFRFDTHQEKTIRMAGSAVGRLRFLVTSNSWLKPLLKAISSTRCGAWDLIHGVDTCGDVPLATLDFQSKNKTAGLEYQSHHPGIIRAGLMALAVRPQDFIFIDFGCGKGSVLLVSEFVFRRIIGLEFAPLLAETARRNLKSYRSRRQKCSRLKS
jgi:hypothetical protein